MIELWRRWAYKRYERRTSRADNFAEFEQFASGPWTPAIVSKMPWDVMVKGPSLGGIDEQTRKVIDMEMARRAQPVGATITIILSSISLVVSIAALFKTS